MRKNIALYDSDSIYAARFMEYFRNKQEFEWEITAFTKMEKLEVYLQGHSLEILLVGSREKIEELPADKVQNCYLLTEERQEGGSEPTGIFRYQSVEHIMEQVLTDYMKKQDERSTVINPKRMNIITVFSPVADGQDAALAWSLGFLLARQRRVLLLPLELFPMKQVEFIDPARQGISEFIYYLKENSNILSKLKELLNYSNNLTFLTGASHGFDLLSLNKEDIHRWITMLRTNTDYHSVIFYLSFYHEAGIELLKLSDRVVVIKGQSSYEDEVYREWERQMDCVGIDLQQQKFKSIYRTTEWGGTETYHNLQELCSSSIGQQAQEYLKSE